MTTTENFSVTGLQEVSSWWSRLWTLRTSDFNPCNYNFYTDTKQQNTREQSMIFAKRNAWQYLETNC